MAKRFQVIRNEATKIRKRAAAICLLILVIALSLSLNTSVTHAANTRHNLTIKVIDQSSQIPLANANVTIIGPERLSELTDSNGVIVFSDILEGNYSVVTAAPGYPMSSTQTLPPLTSDLSVTAWYSFTKAFFTYSPTRVSPEAEIQFDGSSSDSSGVILSYEWSFGDGQTGSGRVINHFFAKTGEYHVSLTVTSSVGAAQYSQVITVNSSQNDYIIFILIPVVAVPLMLLLLFFQRRRRYYVVIQAHIPLDIKQIHCPGNNTDCEDCKLTPC
jgi:hypothetical protein